MAEELTIKVGADVAQALAGLGQVHGKVGDLDQAAQKAHSGGLGGLIGGLGSLISPATLAAAGVAAVGATLFDSVGKAGEFGQKMAEIKATMQPTGDEMQKLHGLALDLGKDLTVGSVSAKDAADAIFELGKSGVSTEAQLGGVTKATLQLAAAAGPEFGVANAAALAGDTLNTFGLDASHATEVVNDLVGAANASSTGLQEMKYSFAAVGPVAAQMGFSVYDTAEAFALFANHGMKGSDAGTSLKTMMLNLHPTTKTGTALMKELGLITKDGGNAFFDAHGKVKDFNEIAGIMRGTFGKLNPEMQAFYAKQIFGTDAVRAVAIMSGSTDKELNKLGDDMEKQGNAAKIAADMNNNFKGKMEALGGTIDTIKIQIGEALTPALGQAADAFNQLLGDAMAGDWNKVGGDIGGAFMSIQGAVIGAIPGIMQGLGQMGQALIDWIGPRIPEMLAKLGELGNQAWTWITGTALPLLVAKVSEWGKAFIDWIGPRIPPMLAKMGELAGQLWNWITGTALPAIITKLSEWGKAFIEWVGPKIPPLLAELGKLATTLLNWIFNDALPKVVSEIGKWGKAFIDWVGPKIPGMLQELGKLSGKLLDWLVNTALPTIVTKLGEWALAFLKWVVPMIPPFLVELAKILVAIGTWIITTALPAIVSKIGEWKNAFLDWIVKDLIPQLGPEMKKIYDKIGTWISTTANDLVKDAAALGKGLIDGIIDGVKGLGTALYNKITGMIGGAVDEVKKFFGIQSPSTYTAQYIGIPLGEGITRGALTGATGLGAALSGKIAQELGTAIPQSVQNVAKMTQDQIDNALKPKLWKSLDGIWQGLNGGDKLGGVGGPGGGPFHAMSNEFHSVTEQISTDAGTFATAVGQQFADLTDKNKDKSLTSMFNTDFLDKTFQHTQIWTGKLKEEIFGPFFIWLSGKFSSETAAWDMSWVAMDDDIMISTKTMVDYVLEQWGRLAGGPSLVGAGAGPGGGSAPLAPPMTPGGSGGGTTNVHVYLDGAEISHALRTVSAIRNDL